MDYLSIIENSYVGYSRLIWETITSPFKVENYFYYLIYTSLFVWLLEIIFPWRKSQKLIRKGFWVDVFYMFFNFYILNLLFFIALSNVTSTLFLQLSEKWGLPTHGFFDFGVLPLWAQFTIFFLLADFIQWGIHNTLHRVPFLWKFHKVHHSVVEMGFAAHLRFHFVETFLYKTALYLFLSYMLSFKLEYAFVMHYITILIGHLNHANVGWDYGVLKYILNNPKMHIWHHAKKLPSSHPKGMNFGISLSLWDYLFGTDYIPSDGKEIELGFDKVEEYPTSFIELQYKPFIDKSN